METDYKYGDCMSKSIFGRDADMFFLVQILEALGMQSMGDKREKIEIGCSKNDQSLAVIFEFKSWLCCLLLYYLGQMN